MPKFVEVPFTQRTPCVARPPIIDHIPLGRSVIFDPQHDTPFDGYIESCGHEERRGTYKYDGRQRKEPRTIFQYTIAGCGQLRSGGQTYELTPGKAMVLILPHPHKYWLPAMQPSWRFVFVSLSGSHILGIWRWLMRKAGPVVDLSSDSEPVILACEICRRAHQGVFDDDFLSADFAHRLTFSLCEVLLSNDCGNRLPMPLIAAKEFIDQSFQKPIGMPDVAAAAGVSPNNLTELFHTHENTTPRAFLEQRRLERACFLLSTTQQSISEVATSSGFSNSNYFAKVFRRLMGTSPGHYREKIS